MTPPETSAPPSQHPLLRSMVEKQQEVGYGFLVAAVVATGLTVGGAGWWAPEAKEPIIAAGTILAAAFLVAGLVQLFLKPITTSPQDMARLLLLGVGGMSGLALVVGGICLGYHWWDDALAWTTAKGPGEKAWRSLVVLVIFVVGLAIMFASLQLGKSDERDNAFLRRLLYGFNGVLTGLLLLAILFVLNVLVGVRGQTPIDFTRHGRFTLSPLGQNILKGLDKPVEIINFPGYREDGLDQDVRDLLAACRANSDKIQIKEVSMHLDQTRYRELQKTYPALEEGSLLIVYGDKEGNQVIKGEEMTQPTGGGGPQGMMGGGGFNFTGEDALMTALKSLSEGKQRPAIYFTQGHGELDLTDMRRGGRLDRGAGVLKSGLERQNFDVKPLRFDPTDAKVPPDAAVLVIAGPRTPLSPTIVQALRAYMSKGGKLVILLDVVPNNAEGKAMMPTGLEVFLGEFGVQAPPEQLLTLPLTYRIEPTGIVAGMNSRLEDNPLVIGFEDADFVLFNARPVQPAPSQPGMSRWVAQTLMLTKSESWAEPNLGLDPAQFLDNLRVNNAELKRKVAEMEKRGPIPVAVTVSEGGMNPRDPHGMGGPQAKKPRMVVIGNASLAANTSLTNPQRRMNFPLVMGCLDYLRDRPSVIGIPAKPVDQYAIPTRTEDEKKRMIILPPILIVTSLLGLATGVWIVRRR